MVMILSAAMALLLAALVLFAPIGVALNLATDHSPAFFYKAALGMIVMAIVVIFVATKCCDALRKPK